MYSFLKSISNTVLDDGYNSASWTRESTFDTIDEKVVEANQNNYSKQTLNQESIKDHITVDSESIQEHITVDKSVTPHRGHVCQLVLGVVGSTASAPIFTQFGKAEDKDIPSGRELESEIIHQYDEERRHSAATRIQAGFKGMLVRRNMKTLRKSSDMENLEAELEIAYTRESSAKVSRVGAIPFEQHETVPKSKDLPEYTNQDPFCQENIPHTDEKMLNVQIYTLPNHASSQMLILYLKERQIPFSDYTLSNDDLKELWFLELSPTGNVPVINFGNKKVSDILKIFDFLEENIPVDRHQSLVPCTTSTRLYQKYLFYSSLLESIDVWALQILSSEDKQVEIEKLQRKIDYLQGLYKKL